MTLLVTLPILLSAFFGNVLTEREHKVHNIVLYPEKHSWCQTTPIQQIVASPGYEPVTIDNNVCVGACYSYSIPKTQPAEPGELIGPYCDSCQPSDIKCYHVNLRADQKNPEGPAVLQKRVQVIVNCSCQSCDKIRKENCEITDGNTLELPENLFTNTQKANAEDRPELLEDLGHNAAKQPNPPTENDIAGDDGKERLRAKYRAEYQNLTEDEESNAKLLQKLNDVVLKRAEENDAKIENGDLEGLPGGFGFEGAPSHHKGNHVAMGAHGHDAGKKHHGHHGGHHQHRGDEHQAHHLGEEQQIGANVVHLERGPHGSMVAFPVDELKPNNEGVILDYENHHKNPHKLASLTEN